MDLWGEDGMVREGNEGTVVLREGRGAEVPRRKRMSFQFIMENSSSAVPIIAASPPGAASSGFIVPFPGTSLLTQDCRACRVCP